MATALAAAPELAQAYLLQLAGGLHPIAAFAARAVGPRWALVPAYAAAFLQLFALAQLFWRHIAGVRDARKAALLASCVLSTAHGSLTTLASLAIARPWVAAARAAAPAGGAWWAALALDGASSAAELRLTQFTLAYLLADTAFMLLWTPNDRALITHHALAATYFFIIHALGVGGVTVAFTLALGECTAPLLNAFTVAKELRGERAWAAAAFPALSMAFTGAFFVFVAEFWHISLLAPFLPLDVFSIFPHVCVCVCGARAGRGGRAGAAARARAGR
jgi:hypothetical protein